MGKRRSKSFINFKTEKWTNDNEQADIVDRFEDKCGRSKSYKNETIDKNSNNNDKDDNHVIIPVPIPVKTINNKHKTVNTLAYKNNLHCIVEENTNLENDNDSIANDNKIQEDLIKYTLPTNESPLIEISAWTSSNTLITTNSENIIKLKKNWLRIILLLLDRIDKFESILYEKFWWSILYLNFWFPRLSHLIMYVN